MQVGKFPKIDKRVGWNKAVQFGILIGTMKNKFSGIFSKTDKRAGWNKAGALKKNDKLCCTFIR